jgi:hypothetical protein
MLLLYGEMETLFGWFMKKKTKRMVLKIYWYGALLMIIGLLFQKYFAKKNTLSESSDK